ncbi:mitochondrial carrier protein [Cryptococcus bacillisporus CA1873]|uniref:Mitochondrial carrier protein n=1 Tax=Cryptococcus bacillisporus CA1873 TaxID=1296111 RepID=A0ABR5BB31_CRYGA|nr:mitochondrial carrier protein [Cryptococcus bacillisporus CA1873]|eukprot:KIR62579.1 mitochondrial carrier protein [Cryptococcus gattii CA1873]
MESLVDVITTVFQAILAVNVVFTVGYAYNGKRVSALSKTLSALSNNLLLPLLILTTFAASPSLTWKRLLQLWPLAIISLATHAASLVASIVSRRYFRVPGWAVESLTYNNVGSYPFLVLYALYRVSTVGCLNHLHWRIKDTTAQAFERATVYILINFLITKLFRDFINPFILRSRLGDDEQDDADENVEDGSYAGITEAAVGEDATERTSLLVRTHQPDSTKLAIIRTAHSPILLSAILGLTIGLVKPLQRFITGVGVEGSSGGWLWLAVGSALNAMGGSFPLFAILATGAAIRAGERPPFCRSPEYKTPPTLGTVLLLGFWRYICIPAITFPIVKGFHKIPSTKVFLQDPSFVLVLTVITPPLLPSRLSPFRSSVLFSTFYSSLITAIPLALAIGLFGRGVSYDLNFDLVSALKSAAGGGLAGAAAMVVQVLTLMPMRTIMNYQYRYGGGLKSAAVTLYEDGGYKRYYAGLAAALFQGPLSRFGDTAANAGILALLSSLPWPVLVKTVAASVASACFRMTLTPIDTIKTTQQTQGGRAGLKLIRERIREQGVASMWYGALATAAATFVGHYPWFGTYNYLQATLPLPHTIIQKLFRQAFIGFAASLVSDTSSNSLRVVKTYRQVHEGDVGYLTAAKKIVEAEGWRGLFGRGLGTRLLTNGLQGLLFSILWKLFADL